MAGPLPLSADAALTLLALGRAELRASSADGASRTLLGPGKPLALVTYLALVPSRAATREHLVDLLWADAEPDAAKHSLRQTLWHLRTRCGIAVTGGGRADHGLISLVRELTCDRDLFLAAIADRRFEEAIALYRGEFLPDFALPGGLEFEQWADVERQRLRAAFHRCAEAVVRQWLEVARHRDAIALARRLRDGDPENEATWRLLLEALVAARDALGAATEADALEQLLQREGQEPEPATRVLLRQARRDAGNEVGVTGEATLVTELVGRQAEFARLIGAWDAATRGNAQHVQILGAAGLGKSRLLADLAARLRSKRGRVVLVRAQPGDGRISGALLGELAGALATLPGAAGISPESARCLIALDPRLSSVLSGEADSSVGVEAARRRVLAVHELVAAIADESPLAILIDDLHWADQSSVDVVASVVSRLARERVLVVTATRPGAASALAPAPAYRIPLWPLSVEHVAALLGSVAELPPAAWAVRLVAALHAASGGSPLLLLETLHSLMERGLLLRAASDWTLSDEGALFALLSKGSALRDRVRRCDPTEIGVLRTLAAGGFPLEPSLLVGADRTLDTVRTTLDALEQRGLVSRVGHAWQPAHDEIADATLALSSAGDLVGARAQLGAAIAESAGDDSLLLRRAGPLLAAGGSSAALRLAFRRWAAAQRRSGDRRPPRAIAAEFVGAGANDPIATGLVRSLPINRQIPRAVGWGAPALVLMIVGAAAARFARSAPPAPQPDAVAFVVDTAGDPRGFALPLRLADMASGDVLALDRVGTPDSIARRILLNEAAIAPDGRSVAYAVTSRDSGAMDVMLLRLDGSVRRLTSDPHDDFAPSWSPDGRRLAFLTGRYDSLEHNGVAVMDPATGRARRVTGGPSADYGPQWSPLGTHIAFGRRHFDDAPAQVCRTGADGAGLRCFGVRGDLPQVIAWYDARRVLVVIGGTQSPQRIELMNLFTGESTPVASVGVGLVTASPDGRWIACACRDAALGRVRTIVFPTGRPDLVREIRRSRFDDRPLVVGWRPRSDAEFLDTLRIVGLADTVPLTAPVRARAVGIARDGHRIDIPPVRWATSDSGIATVDSAGVVTPHAIGVAELIASAGGWRRTRMALTIARPSARHVFHEDWTDGFARFGAFGEPAPVIYRSGDGAAMWNRGDKSYASGVISNGSFDTRDGLTVEARVSIPITMTQWQRIAIELLDAADSAAIGRWDRRTGSPPAAHVPACSVSLPANEGVRGSGELALMLPDRSVATSVGASVRSGVWHSLRLQLFRGGGCGVSIDGRPVAFVLGGTAPPRRVLVMFDGFSYRTRVLVGVVDVWTGLPGDIDWRVPPG